MNELDPAALPAPVGALVTRLTGEADAMERAGHAAEAAAVRSALETFGREQAEWSARLAELLGSHHEINNALVGVRGNAQLLLMNPAGQQPGIREKLEVILRESGRIQEAARRLHELKTSFRGDAPHSRAA